MSGSSLNGPVCVCVCVALSLVLFERQLVFSYACRVNCMQMCEKNDSPGVHCDGMGRSELLSSWVIHETQMDFNSLHLPALRAKIDLCFTTAIIMSDPRTSTAVRGRGEGVSFFTCLYMRI